MKLSIEELKDVVANAKTSLEQYLALELIELKGDQVPVAWTSQRSLETKNKIVAFTDYMSALDYGTANGWTDIVELFTAPQKLTDLPYDVLFNAIGKAVNIQGEALSISVKAFKAEIEAAGCAVSDK